VNIVKIRKKVLVNSNGLMEAAIEVIGQMDNNMDKGPLLAKMEKRNLVNGKKERE